MTWFTSPLLQAAAVVGALGGIGGTAYEFWPSPTIAQFKMTDTRSVENKIRWLLQDKFNALAALQRAKDGHERLFWKSKIEAINIQLTLAINRVRK